MALYRRPIKTANWLAIAAIVVNYVVISETTKGSEAVQEFVISSNSPAPIPLGPSPKRFDIRGEVIRNLSERLDSQPSRLYLVIDDIRRSEPINLFFLVVLTATPDAAQVFTNEDRIGTFNLFEEHQRLATFDITDRFRSLSSMRGANLAVFVQPALGQNAGERAMLQRKMDGASITIGRVRLVLQ